MAPASAGEREGDAKRAAAALERLLLPGTSEGIRANYQSLSKRAATHGFDLLEEDVVVLDTETTGLSFKDCALMEISAARLSGREPVERFETFVDPGRPIPPEIQRLTGIRDIDVAGAPSPEEAVRALADFVGGVPVLAHNATFDRTFIEGVRGGAEVSDTWIDTLALSRIALPRLSSHRLSDMAEAFGCDSVTHRAGDDVDALCGMWRIILLGLSDLPAGLLGKLSEMHPEVEWPFRPVISHLAAEGGPEPFSLKALRHSLVALGQARPRIDAAALDAPLRAPSPEAIRDEFKPDGAVGRMYESYETRPEQVSMALEVREALATSTHRTIEAGTGVGKSIAYLLPEVLFAQRNNVTVGIATKTNALTDQLVSHELPALARALPRGLAFHSLKGYEHYPCLHRLDRAAVEGLPLELARNDGRSDNAIACDMLTAIAVTYAYACQSPDGDLDALGIRWRYVPRQMLTTTPGECLRARCPYFPNECLVHGARRHAASGDVVVTNHSLLLRNVAAGGKILPPIRHWVVDEAHSFESEARRQWAREVSGEAARAAFELLGGTESGALHTVMASVSASRLEGATLVQGLLTKAAASVSRASVSTADLFMAVHELGSLARGDGGYDMVTLWIDDGVRKTSQWGAVAEAGSAAVAHLDEAARHLGEAEERLAELAPQLAADLTESGRFVSDLLESLRLVLGGEDQTYVYSAELYRSKRRIGAERLLAEKLDVGADLARDWLPEMQSVVFTSATMAVRDDFSHFDHAVGLDRLADTLRKDVRLDSSFDYDGSMSVIVTKDMPAPNESNYLDALVDLLYSVHCSMDGSVLTLFTNRRDMERVYAVLGPRLDKVGLALVCQERGSSPRRLRQRFLAERRASLLALRSFWEGFDATGDTLRCVVIPKLPFASPNDPIVRERDLREERAWWRYSLPEAVISVKQAAGRLIRTSSDRGVLVLADSRVVQKRYGRSFTGSLPSKSVTTLETENVGRYIEMWRASHER
ncbi:MAG: DNA polymerase III subunit epsilon [Coriobacteriaceae bacterium]|nr:DNA polymerase III subunit epsilon [Coriobacteriaceae bacterium]MCI6843517.1 DNA polymerase III subunit epsilon [Coriobacteriaceae bacterium]MDD7584732.1 helicase C-terminal domain-containing protein [Coriobacteriaceae bacterium]